MEDRTKILIRLGEGVGHGCPHLKGSSQTTVGLSRSVPRQAVSSEHYTPPECRPVSSYWCGAAVLSTKLP